jgi:hypothetical protein
MSAEVRQETNPPVRGGVADLANLDLVRGGVADLANLDLTALAVERLLKRSPGLPGIAVLHGPAGWGKSVAAARMALRYQGYYVQMRSCWTRKSLLEKIAADMGIKPAPTLPAILDQLAEQLAASRRPLLIDEFDYCAGSRALVELVRDLHEASGQAAILCIGEEGLPQALVRYERFHSRVLAWVAAAPCNLADARKLRPLYCPDVEVADDFLAHLIGPAVAAGSVRRVAVNLELIQETGLAQGWRTVDRKGWGARPLYTGRSPERRKVG